jgi:hypothetical protein
MHRLGVGVTVLFWKEKLLECAQNPFSSLFVSYELRVVVDAEPSASGISLMPVRGMPACTNSSIALVASLRLSKNAVITRWVMSLAP